MQRERRVRLGCQDAMGQMGRREKWDVLALQDAKETQATGDLTVTMET